MTHRLAVFGNPVAHSRSPEIHQMFAAEAGIDVTYEKVLVPLGGFRAAADDFFQRGGTGINITVPFKKDAFNFVGSLSDGARDAGAVNTILRMPNDSLKGDNTDGAGLVSDLQDNLGWPLVDKSILLLGAGGAIQGVIRDILNASPKNIVVANRTVSKAEELVRLFEDERVSSSPLNELSGN
ncbi:MAG: shikimate dehydrogenase, partial [Candidatus Azotimanducaceae bacterium]